MVILINPFEVPVGGEEQFFKVWNKAAEQMRQSPGCISTELHQSLDPQAKFRFVNVAHWESAQHYQAASANEAIQKLRTEMPFHFYPALYQVVYTESE